MNTWKQVTERDSGPLDDFIEFSLTKNDRDQAALARLDILAMKRAQGRFVPGLVAKAVSPDDLTPAERAAFGLEAPHE